MLDNINPKKILIIKFKHIGDVLLSVPTLNTLHQQYPDAEIHYLVNQGTEAMVSTHPLVSTVHTLPSGLSKAEQLKRILTLRREHYDMSVDLCGGGDRGAIWSRLINARYRLGSLPINQQKGMRGKKYLYTHLAPTPSVKLHSVIRDLDIVRAFDIKAPHIQLDMHIPAETVDSLHSKLPQADLLTQDYVLIHPTSRWLFKCIDDHVMADVIDTLQTTHKVKVIVSCGPDKKELSRLEAILAYSHSDVVAMAGNLSLYELGALMQHAQAFLGVDSAPAHMAAALNTPSVVIFGPTGAYNWGPWVNNTPIEQPYPHRKGLQKAGQYTILQKDWGCVPCGKSGCDHSGKSDCLLRTTKGDILKQLLPLLPQAKAV
ncbi:MAG TPA: putative lipopolysaccharide heptosyltransferase III [Thiothrix sp.]|nr:putative lipopolysaccharide heptosyltransferase III [Thiothrix sp.]